LYQVENRRTSSLSNTYTTLRNSGTNIGIQLHLKEHSSGVRFNKNKIIILKTSKWNGKITN